MDSSGQTTVLVADVSGGSKLYEAAGYAAALEVIARCIERVRDAAPVRDRVARRHRLPPAAADVPWSRGRLLAGERVYRGRARARLRAGGRRPDGLAAPLHDHAA